MLYQVLLVSAFAAVMGSAYKTIDVDELVKYQEEKKVLIIDVREPSEIQQTGVIPGGINIPMADLDKAFAMSAEDFEATYGKKKPEKTDKIIFSCLAGKRSKIAVEKFVNMGYTEAINYSGGWTGWEKYKKEHQ